MDTQKIETAVKMIIEQYGEDINREGLQETPARVAACIKRFFQDLVKLQRSTCQNPLKLSITIW